MTNSIADRHFALYFEDGDLVDTEEYATVEEMIVSTDEWFMQFRMADQESIWSLDIDPAKNSVGVTIHSAYKVEGSNPHPMRDQDIVLCTIAQNVSKRSIVYTAENGAQTEHGPFIVPTDSVVNGRVITTCLTPQIDSALLAEAKKLPKDFKKEEWLQTDEYNGFVKTRLSAPKSNQRVDLVVVRGGYTSAIRSGLPTI